MSERLNIIRIDHNAIFTVKIVALLFMLCAKNISSKGESPMRIITIANQKGGIGKTTTAVSLASILESLGHHTLLIDTDVQCNSTDTYQAKTDGVATLYDVILEEDPPTHISEAIQHTEYGDIVAGDKGLREADTKLTSADAFCKLREAIEDLPENVYEYVIIDTNPNINVMLNNALVAATDVIVPFSADRYAMQGLGELTDSIAKVKKYLNPGLKIDGLLLVKFDERGILNRDVKEALVSVVEQIGTRVFDTYIRYSVKCREAQAYRMPLIRYAPRSTTHEDYVKFVKEFLGEVE